MANKGTMKINGALQLGRLSADPSSPLAGLIYYNQTAGEFRLYNGSGFVQAVDFSQLGNTTNSANGASSVGTDSTFSWVNISPASNNVESVLESIDSALSNAGATSFDEANFEIFKTGASANKLTFDLSALSAARAITMPNTAINLGDIATNASGVSTNASSISTNSGNISTNSTSIGHLVTLSGVASNSDDLGTFTGTTITDNDTVKQALQELETAVEGTAASADVSDLITLSGVAANSTNLGIFTGSTIADNSTVKVALQSLETEVELKSNTADLSSTSNAKGASLIGIEDSGALFTATDTEAALAEVKGVADAAIPSSEKGSNSGVATLDTGGKVPASQLPNSIMDYLGTWTASTNTPSLADGTGSAGDVYVSSDSGSVNFGSGSISFAAGDWVIYSGSVWQKSVNSNAVASVNGLTGAVVLDTGDFSENGNLFFTDERAQDAIGLMATDSSKVSLTYVDATPSLTADIVAASLVNADISASAAIAYSKLDLTGNILNADISASAAIAYSKLDLSNSIVNTDINSSAAIAGSKISPDFGSQDIQTSGSLLLGTGSNVIERNYLHNETLTASSTSQALAALTFDSQTYKTVIIHYSIEDSSSKDRRGGTMLINLDEDNGVSPTAEDLVEFSGETGDVGVTWDLNLSGTSMQVRYTTTANNKTMNAEVVKILA